MMGEMNFNTALNVLSEVQNGSIEPAAALNLLSDVIVERLRKFKVNENTQNAGQIANIMIARLFPENPLSAFVLKGLDSGDLPNFSNDEPEENAIQRGCAVFALNVRDSYSNTAPKMGGKIVYDFIEYMDDKIHVIEQDPLHASGAFSMPG